MDITYNTHCYTFELIEREKGFLDEAVDATYIIHLEGNGRWDHIVDQLRTFVPSQRIYIVKNKGFKACNKRLPEQETYTDLTDAFLQCFQHAKAHHYGNILVLEDDFIFHRAILEEPEHIKAVTEFVQTHDNEPFYYHLGCMPVIVYPEWSDRRTYRSMKSFGMHATIYSKQMVENMDTFPLEEKHWDIIAKKSGAKEYLYYRPLCYQTFPETENKQQWNVKDSNRLMSYLKNTYIRQMHLDERPEPGTTTLYYFAKGLTLFLFFLPIVLLLILFYYRSKPRGGQ
jgi:hypothetical protein